MARRSVMEHRFSEVPKAEIQRSSFDRSHGHKTCADVDVIFPILIDDIIPGDTFSVGTSFVARLASPTILPLLDNMTLTTFAFFVPYRILWDNWEKFMGAQDDPGDSIDFTIPVYENSTSFDISSGSTRGLLADYMGVPMVTNLDGNDVSALPFRAYQKIFNEWFRDENLQDSLTEVTDNGPDTSANYVLQVRGKRHDYFTSCLPWPQKGTAVSLPLGTTAPVIGIGVRDLTDPFTALAGNIRESDGTVRAYTWDTFATNAADWIRIEGTAEDGIPNIRADLTNATAATINDLRLAFQTQKLLERDARSGTRYVETLKAHWGVSFPDYRLQRPEYLGGGSSKISISPIAQTTYQGTQTIEDAKGALGGIGQVNGTHHFTKSFVEHGCLMVLANISGDITYSQGLERMWSKRTRYEFFYPVLSTIGEQSVINKELYYQNTAADDLAFGYIGRYDEYRYKPSRLSLQMRPTHASSLEAFHLSEEFTSLPTLGNTFIQSNTRVPLDRAVSVPSEPHFVCDFYFDMKCARPMPLYGVPGNLDRF